MSQNVSNRMNEQMEYVWHS